MTVDELCRLLVSGSVDSDDVPELVDEDIRAEVQERLAGVGCALAYSPGTNRWVARLDGPLPRIEGHDQVLKLHAAELAALAACWLHLRFLPAGRAKVVSPRTRARSCPAVTGRRRWRSTSTGGIAVRCSGPERPEPCDTNDDQGDEPQP